MFNTVDFEKLLDEKTNEAIDQLRKSVRDSLIYGSGIAIIRYDADSQNIKVINKKPQDVIWMEIRALRKTD